MSSQEDFAAVEAALECLGDELAGWHVGSHHPKAVILNDALAALSRLKGEREAEFSPLVCADCGETFGKVPRDDMEAAKPLIQAHNKVCTCCAWCDKNMRRDEIQAHVLKCEKGPYRPRDAEPVGWQIHGGDAEDGRLRVAATEESAKTIAGHYTGAIVSPLYPHPPKTLHACCNCKPQQAKAEGDKP